MRSPATSQPSMSVGVLGLAKHREATPPTSPHPARPACAGSGMEDRGPRKGSAPSPRAHADGTSMIGPWMEDRGSRMSGSLILPLPIQNVNPIDLPPFTPSPASRFVRLRGLTPEMRSSATSQPKRAGGALPLSPASHFLHFDVRLVPAQPKGDAGCLAFDLSGEALAKTDVRCSSPHPAQPACAGSWMEDRGSRMSGSLMLPLPIQNVNPINLAPFRPSPASRFVRLRGLVPFPRRPKQAGEPERL
jgi:hypothetical protein